MAELKNKTAVACYHCGESCRSEAVSFDNKEFCCDGCKTVYDILKDNNLCTYYNISSAPGISPEKNKYSEKYKYLDNDLVSRKLIRFTDEQHTHITFYIPKIHCSSCIWLLENLHKLNKGVISSQVNFLRKEATVVFNNKLVKLSQVAQLLSNIGYEPLIHLNDLEKKPESKTGRDQIVKIGLAGFCFGNIMMLSFPEYFSFGNFYEQENLKYFFGYLNLFLSLPVFFYSASGFFSSAWKSLRHRYLNIDAPIALAILVTFARSVYEITSQTGAGYMDSMTGIVFFMLIGRYFQNRTYDTLSFERDYRSYFPVGVTVVKEEKEQNLPVSELKKSDRIIIRNSELIPCDAILISGQTHIDYSFITGESAPVKKQAGDLIYAGGKQLDGAIELEVAKPISQSYLTQLWNQDTQSQQHADSGKTYVDNINKYFTTAVLSIAALSALYWMIYDSSKALNALTAVLIVACPCGLLLTTSFANGNILRIMGRNKFYLKNASVIEKLANIDTILFDKTGTITHGSEVTFVGPALKEDELQLVTSLAAQSSHPLSRKICSRFAQSKNLKVSDFEEIPGKGIKGDVNGKYIVLGSEYFVTGDNNPKNSSSTNVFLMIDGETIGFFRFSSAYREGLNNVVDQLGSTYQLNLLSGDNDSERQKMESVFRKDSGLHFNLKPEEKKGFVEKLQQEKNKVLMIGDGLNDAGALMQSDIGIAISDDTNNFSPACDAILDGSSFNKLPSFLRLSKETKKVIIGTFIVSSLYNVIGLLYASQGILSPVVATILMPISSVSIVLITTIATNILAKGQKL